MKKHIRVNFYVIALVSITFTIFFSLLMIDYSGQVLKDTPLYTSDANEPFKDKLVQRELKKYDQIHVVGCYDDNKDIYFRIKTPDGEIGYLYTRKLVVENKVALPSWSDLEIYFEAPFEKIQCLYML